MDDKNITNPLVSVIVPVYNVSEFLERCVKSIIEQTYANLEILLINDGSTDESGEICIKLAKNDNRIKVFHQTNKGQSEARNTGLENIKGDYVLFVDSDDWIKPKMVETLLGFSIENKLDLVECGIVNSRDLNKKSKEIKTISFVESQPDAMLRLLNTNNFSVWRRFYSRNLIANRKFIPGKINEDVFFTIDTINRVSRQGYLNESLYVYNTENESITRSAYSLKKLDAKDALYHIVNETKHYNTLVRTKAQQYLLRGLINHFNPLFLHAHLDPKFRIRRALRQEIRQQTKEMESLTIPTDFSNFEKFFVLKLPLRIYGVFRVFNYHRIQLQLRLLRVFHV
ncbi:glycosyltransferase [Maribacter aurantiacus]|uniref:Glycosyltransferase n=1 Tax=Maribacter aurantiacus TaxID=1882343 RepID=A0A5R8M4X1_9FLAO|nr:glycosyltransferase [Maribacter aurantiacus]TLF44555.1 glycosyltransferase [Maribacter aurantiacus]